MKNKKTIMLVEFELIVICEKIEIQNDSLNNNIIFLKKSLSNRYHNLLKQEIKI